MNHTSVMLDEVVNFAEVSSKKDLVGLDATLGLGGHSKAFLDANPKLVLYAIDKDNTTRMQAIKRFTDYETRFSSAHLCFSQLDQLDEIFEKESLEFDFILADLGVSSMQLDSETRGFSFKVSSDLDMRMDESQKLTAWHVLNEYSERSLLRVFSQGGLRTSVKNLVREVVASRPIESTSEFKSLCNKVIRKRPGSADSATVPFQAVRIEVNSEYQVLLSFLRGALERLKADGKLIVICFHSTEDLIVARAMRWWSSVRAKGLHPEDQPIGKMLTSDAVLPSTEEIEANPRARSAKLRVFKRNESNLWSERGVLPESLSKFVPKEYRGAR